MKRFLVPVLAAVLVGVIPPTESSIRADALQGRPQRLRFYAKSTGIAGRYMVRLADSAAGRRGRFSRAGVTAFEVANDYGITRIRRVYSYAINGFNADMSEEVARRVSLDPRVEYVVQDSRGTAMTTQPDAPWGIDRIDQETGTDTTYSYENEGAGVTVYVLDSGIRHTHEDFDGRATLGPAFLTNYPGATATDGLNHGTLVASVIGGDEYGVAKAVSLVSVRVVDQESESSAGDIVEGIDWITQYHSSPAVVNASLAWEGDEYIDEAVENSLSAGITWVVAAGNGGGDAGALSPQRVDGVIVVGSINSSDQRPNNSNKGSTLTLFAPGVDIPAASASGDTHTTSGFGTSMASPHVAGIAARYLGLFPTASPADVKTAILDGASELTVGNAGAGSPHLIANSEFLDGDPTPPSTPSCGDNDCLFATDALYPGWDLESANMQYILSYQGDGNLVLYDSAYNVLWAADTHNTDANLAVMQGDGNFVVYDDTWASPWSSNTAGNNGAWLILQNDGNLVIYEANNGPAIKSIRYECGPQCS